MEIGIGQKYSFKIKNITLSPNPSNDIDIFTILAAANVPCLMQRFVMTANVNQAQNVPVVPTIRSSAGTGGTAGGTGTAFTSTASPPSGPNASETLAYNVATTVGTVVKELGGALWQLFGQYEFQRKPGGELWTPGQYFTLCIPTGGIGTGGGFSCSAEGEYIALK